MKLDRANPGRHALTLVEVLVVLALLALLVPMFLPDRPVRATRLVCLNNLKQIGLAGRIWADDNGGKYPVEISRTNGGTLELSGDGNRFQYLSLLNYLAVSNELGTPKILHCPADPNGLAATTFTANFNNQNLSYFVGLDAGSNRPSALLVGDDNFEISGVPVKPGLLEVHSNSIGWPAARHQYAGNIGLANGSVQMVNNAGLARLLSQTGLATNRLAIP